MLSRTALVLLSVLAFAPQEGQQILQVAPLTRGDEVLVSFKLAQEPTEEIRNAIRRIDAIDAVSAGRRAGLLD